MRPEMTVHLEEARPGLGALDYATYLREVSRLARDIPVMLEHLPQEEYVHAREHVVGVAEHEGLSFGL
jgi:hypothetical protein